MRPRTSADRAGIGEQMVHPSRVIFGNQQEFSRCTVARRLPGQTGGAETRTMQCAADRRSNSCVPPLTHDRRQRAQPGSNMILEIEASSPEVRLPSDDQSGAAGADA